MKESLDITLCSGEFCPCRESCLRYIVGLETLEREAQMSADIKRRTSWVAGANYDHGRGRCDLFKCNNYE